MVERFDQGVAIGLCAKSIESHGVKALEDIAVLAVLWRTAMVLDEALDLLEAGDYPLLASCPA
jgi:hypothetical protein